MLFVADRNVDYLGETDEDGLLPGPRRLFAPTFRLKMCGDPIVSTSQEPNCLYTKNMYTAVWDVDKNAEREEINERRLKEDLFSSKCQWAAGAPENWRSLAYSRDYENTRAWPTSNQKPDRGAFCGYRSQVVHQGHHIFYHKAYGGAGYYQYKGRDPDQLEREMPHVCMAVKGGIARTYVNIQFLMHDGKGGHRTHRGFLWLAEGDNPEFLYTSPNDGKDWGWHCFNMLEALKWQATKKNWDIDYTQTITVSLKYDFYRFF